MAKVSPGKCYPIEIVKNFNVDAYLGQWFEIRRDASTWYELFGECVNANYALKENGNLRVRN